MDNIKSEHKLMLTILFFLFKKDLEDISPSSVAIMLGLLVTTAMDYGASVDPLSLTPQIHLRVQNLSTSWWSVWQSIPLPTYFFKKRWNFNT